MRNKMGRQARSATELVEGLTGLKAELDSHHEAERPATGFARRHSALIDQFFLQRLQEFGPKKFNFALVAVGGYGRAELSLNSDIDILILANQTIPPQALDLAQPLFLPLWDLGYSLGHGFRIIKDCLHLADKDYQVLASLLDLRFLAGSEAIYEKLHKRFEETTLRKRGRDFLFWLQKQQTDRHAKHGDASGMMEPHLKEGEGGLRDLHNVQWLSRILWGKGSPAALDNLADQEELAQVLRAYDFILTVRDQLHLVSQRKNDKLHLDYQPVIADRLGYKGRNGILPVEIFLGDLHQAMAKIKTFCREFWLEHGPSDKPERSGEEMAVLSVDSTADLLNLLIQAAREGRRLSLAEHRLARSWRQSIRKHLAGTPAVFDFFKNIAATGHAYPVLVSMLETGLLEAVLPEFEAVRDRVQFDGCHTYPVGRHTLEALRELEILVSDQGAGLAYIIWEGLEDRFSLFLAVLFHDLGKSGDSSGHAELGAELSRQVLRYWGASDEIIQEVCFLVARHLLLIETALHRDLGDESVVFVVAAAVQSTKRLDSLYLLTYADSRATGPRAWSDWTSQLLMELYSKVSHVLEQKTLAAPQATQKILRTRDKVRSMSKGLFQLDYVEKALDQMPARYTMTQEPAAIVSHLALMQELDKLMDEERQRLSAGRELIGLTTLETRKCEGGVWELTFGCMHKPGMFATIAGVLALFGVNIVSADVYVWRDSRAVAIFKVLDPPDPVYAEETWSKVRLAVRSASMGKLSLEYRLAERRRSVLSDHQPPGMKPTVKVDNQSSDFYTLIEVQAWDRVGLLYDIAHTLFDMQLSVSSAKIATPGARVVDVFHVRDAFGQKVEDPQQVEEIRKALLHSLEG